MRPSVTRLASKCRDLRLLSGGGQGLQRLEPFPQGDGGLQVAHVVKPGEVLAPQAGEAGVTGQVPQPDCALAPGHVDQPQPAMSSSGLRSAIRGHWYRSRARNCAPCKVTNCSNDP